MFARKLTCLTGILACLTFISFAQDQGNFNAFYQKTDAAAYRGQKFRFHAAVKLETTDRSAQAQLLARVDKADGKPGFFDNMFKKPIKSDQWKEYTIEGVIDSNAKSLTVGAIYTNNGRFCFDDFVLEVRNDAGSWQRVALDNAGFEADTVSSWKFMKSGKGFSRELGTVKAYEGNKYLVAVASGIPKVYGDNDSTGHYVKANGLKIYYEEYGSGEPLLLLHGNSQNIGAFSRQIPEFAKSYHVIAVDTRGHGKTEQKGERYSYDLFAADMNALMNQLHIDSANIVGWSDGGNTGLIMAMKYPGKVKKLVTMGAVIFADSTVVSQGLIDELHFGIEEMKNAKTKEELNDLKKTKLLLEEPNYKFADLKVIKCPVLVMAGEKDIIKYGHTKGIADAIPGAAIYIAPKYSHYFPQENAAAFNQKVLEFLQKK